MEVAIFKTGCSAIFSILVLLFAVVVMTTVSRVESVKEPPVVTFNDNNQHHHQQRNNNNNNNNNKQTKRVFTKTGESFKLTCPVEQSTDTIVDWMKNGQTIHMGWERHKMNDAILRVKEVAIDDGGVYACKATNGFGSVVVKFYVYVSSNESRTAPDPFEVERFFREITGGEDPDIKPFITDLQNYTVNIGETVTWFCDVYSNEEPNIQWFKRIDDPPSHNQFQNRATKNNTVYIGGSRYIPITMDTSMTPSSSENQQQKAVLYSSRLDLPSVDYETQGFYLCAVFTPSHFDFKTAFVKVASGSDNRVDQSDASNRRGSHLTPETPASPRDDLSYVVIGVLVSMVAVVAVIIFLVVRRLRGNRVARNRDSSAATNSKKGCISLPQQLQSQQPMVKPSGSSTNQNHPFLPAQYQYPTSPLPSSSLPQTYPATAPNMAYPVVVGGVVCDDSYSNSTLPSNANLHNIPYPLNNYPQQQQQQQQPKLTSQQLKLFQQQQQIVALYDCGEC